MNRFVERLVLSAMVIATTTTPFTTATVNELQDQDAVTHYQQGVVLLTAEKFDEAIKAFNLAVRLRPDYADAYTRIGEAYTQMWEYKKALEAYKQVIKYQPDSAVAYNNLGDAYSNVDDDKKAIEAYRQAIRLDPKAATVHYKLGVIYFELDKEQSAVAAYKTLEALDASLAQDLYNLIYKPTIPIVKDGLVRLRVIALDSQGIPIRGLASSDFTVAEDDAPQTVSVTASHESPAFYGLAIDTSGSVRPAFKSAIDASKHLIGKLSPKDQALVVRFVSNDKIETVQEFTSNKRLLTDGIDTLFIEAGQSAVLDAVYVTAERLGSYKFPNRNHRRVLLLLTDGEDRASYYKVEQVLSLLRSTDIQVFAISLSSDKDGKLNQNPPRRSVDLLRTLTSETGGATFFPKSSVDLTTAVNGIFDLLRAEYTIEYKPSRPLEVDKYRRVSITIGASQPGNSTVLARPGYAVSKKK